MKKVCPEKVVYAGAMMIRARHAVKSEEDADKVNLPYGSASAFREVRNAVRIAIAELASPAHGIMEMEFGPGLVDLETAIDCAENGKCERAYAHILKAHDGFRKVLDRHNIENPTNDQIAGVIALSNWR